MKTRRFTDGPERPSSMLGKRKRATGESQQPSSSTRSLPLTRPNLSALNDQTRESTLNSVRSYPSPFDVMALPTPSNHSASKSKATTNLTELEHVLDTYRIFMDRPVIMPTILQDLTRQVIQPRATDVTPNSKLVTAIKTADYGSNEITEIWALADKLIYPIKWHPGLENGEAMIFALLDQQWTAKVPGPIDVKEDAALRKAMENLGYPPKPKPDIFFGYDNDAFSSEELKQLLCLPQDLFVHHNKPWFPYLMVQWNSNQKTVRKGNEQTRRDAATAVDAMYRFFTHGAQGCEPSQLATCVFSLVVHAEYFKYRIHWPQFEDGKVSYEGKSIAQAFFNDEDAVFRARSAIIATLTWVRGDRREAIRDKLAALAPVPMMSSPSTAQRTASQSSLFQAHRPPLGYQQTDRAPNTPPKVQSASGIFPLGGSGRSTSRFSHAAHSALSPLSRQAKRQRTSPNEQGSDGEDPIQ
ncbi:MAG: hypothetical protein Q9181_000324 [Wetmoreana brouardii]